MEEVYCDVCEDVIVEGMNFKEYKYIHPITEEPWCDGCVRFGEGLQ